MYLKKISLFNYKNFQTEFRLYRQIICFVGKNGIGKTMT
jgi:predicted ATP-binding protein involved in virulence